MHNWSVKELVLVVAAILLQTLMLSSAGVALAQERNDQMPDQLHFCVYVS